MAAPTAGRRFGGMLPERAFRRRNETRQHSASSDECPKLLIADEPTGDLDAESTAIVMRLLQEVAHDGTAVLMVTHDPDALTYVDRIYRMDRGVLAEP